MVTTQEPCELGTGPVRVRPVPKGGIDCYVKLAADMIRLEWFGYMINGVWYLTKWDWSAAKGETGQ